MAGSVNPTEFFRKVKILAASIGALGLVGWVSYFSGDDLLFSVFYFIPVSLCAWHLGRPTTLLMALACGLAWWYVDTLDGRAYMLEWYRLRNGAICWLALSLLGWMLHRTKSALLQLERVNQELKRALDDLRRSTEAVRRLQDQMQVVCAWTKQIRVAGKWISIEEFLTRHLQLKLSHGMSPEALQKELADFDALDVPPPR